MLEIYKKVEKKYENVLGSEKVEDFSTIDKPFLFCISAQDTLDNSLHGIIKMGARAARVNTVDERGAGFKLDKVGIDFLGYKFVYDNNYENNYDEIVDTAIYPFLMSKGTSIENIKKQARRMNFFTYCNGTYTYVGIEQKIDYLLKQAGFKEEDVNDILSQISLVAVETVANTKKIKCKAIVFLDVNDNEFGSQMDVYKNLLVEKNSAFVKRSDNSYLYIYKGNGEHSLKNYFSDECVAKPTICAAVSKMLNRSIGNDKNNTYNERENLEWIKEIKAYGGVSENKIKKALDHLDNNIVYEGAFKYSDEEYKERVDIDKMCKEIASYNNQNRIKSNTLARVLKNVNNVFSALEQYSLNGKSSLYEILEEKSLLNFEEQEKLFNEKKLSLKNKKKICDLNYSEEYQKIFNAKEDIILKCELNSLKIEYISELFNNVNKAIEKTFGKDVLIQLLAKSGYYQAADNGMLKQIDSHSKKITFKI